MKYTPYELMKIETYEKPNLEKCFFSTICTIPLPIGLPWIKNYKEFAAEGKAQENFILGKIPAISMFFLLLLNTYNNQ